MSAAAGTPITVLDSLASSIRSEMRRLVLARMLSLTDPDGRCVARIEVDAEAAAALGDVDHAGDELGHLLHQRGELVDDDHQRRRRLVGVLLEHLGEVLGLALHQPHAAVQLGPQRRQRPQRQAGVEVGDVADGVRQVLKTSVAAPPL